MPLLTSQDKEARATGTALTYITIGAILTILAGTSFFFFNDPFQDNRILGYIRVATLLIGIVLLGIGLRLGQIARASVGAAEPSAADNPMVRVTSEQARASAERKT